MGMKQETIRKFERYLQFVPQSVTTILDVGCGHGDFLRLLSEKGFEVAGCDIDIAHLGENSQFAPVKKADVLKLSQAYPQNGFDLVACLQTLEHVLQPYTALLELRSVTKRYVLLAVPDARYIIRDESGAHLYSWDRYTFRNLIERAGLKVLKLHQAETGIVHNVVYNILKLVPTIRKILLVLKLLPITRKTLKPLLELSTGRYELIVLCSKK